MAGELAKLKRDRQRGTGRILDFMWTGQLQNPRHASPARPQRQPGHADCKQI